MTHVDIEYCVPCGYLDRAEQIQHQLLETFGQELDSVALVTGDHGVLRVTADDEVVFDKNEGDEYDLDAITEGVRAHLGET
ncbi:selenoprotein [Haloprofundus marisrubri]|uniref:Selenoprotein n=1 Tax=Haloprofundus marisrubri TaxID=1514971 RepID=A0A0W1RBT2_9EURY|nr:Rdx family protein [Haloprofundus marisrubri]KTG10083.1 selenoprotein [Haloprofundus marisrubri]